MSNEMFIPEVLSCLNCVRYILLSDVDGAYIASRMGSEAAAGCISKLLELLRIHRFVMSKICTANGTEAHMYSYGTPGALLRKNILREWWNHMVSSEENTFPVEASVVSPDMTDSGISLTLGPREENCKISGVCLTSSLSKDLLDHYPHSLQQVNKRLPFAQAAVGTCFQYSRPEFEDNRPSPHRLLSHGLCRTHLVHHFYSPPGSASQNYDHWLSLRLRWWRQFSSKPSHFVTSNIDAPDGKTTSSIDYMFPWGQSTIETVCNHGDHDIKQLEEQSGLSHQARVSRKMVYPHVIECQTSLEDAMAAFLADAFQEKQIFSTNKNIKQNGARMVLQFHPHLAPYNVSMVNTGSKSRELRLVTSHWSQELREAGMRVLDTADVSLTQEAQFRRNDELGIPYTVVLNDQTLDTGAITMRHRDTMLKEQVHIAKFKDRLVRYTSPV
ncbi:DNA polymerase subunit gamma-2-like isoform X1 [Haliotis cracherodii]|uniref:DNA polymerase subunit gamma-2-like isoform X1 n=1 Tax=Haliotis cracherodii TaxID=6455 RepID=UPI0039EA1B26